MQKTSLEKKHHRKSHKKTDKKSHKKSHTEKVVLVKTKVSEKKLRSFTKREAIKKCGKGSVNKECRRKEREAIRKREKNFRKTALAACACKSKLSQKCQEKTKTSAKCGRKLNKCRRRCLRKACKVRARVACTGKTTGKTEEKKCRRTRSRRCRKLHLKKHHRKSHKKTDKKTDKKTKVVVTDVQTTTVVSESTKKEIKEQIQKIKQLPEHVISTYTTTVSSNRCGSGDNNKECRDRVSEYTRNQEALFRVSALKSCKCEATTTSTDGVKSCVNTCFENACNIRAVNECVTVSDHTSCVHKVNTKCTTLHVTDPKWFMKFFINKHFKKN